MWGDFQSLGLYIRTEPALFGLESNRQADLCTYYLMHSLPYT
jgi:hypothetical protein